MLRESKQITLVRTTNIPVLHDMLWYWDQHCLILGFLGVWGNGTAVIAELLLLTNSQNLSTFPRPRVQFLVTGAKCILIIISVSHGSASLKKYCCHNAKEKQKLCTEILLFFGIDNYSTRYSTKKVSENGTHSFFILFLLQFCYDARI